MSDEVRAVAGAFAYAWWLTGDEEQAERAVRDALSAAQPADEAALLAQVRRHAISGRTMCPACELALLHDAHGLPLDTAAQLSEIDVRDATTELAHGRLEALLEAPEADFAHPERLGGLAVGNPADVAHARQCTSCGEVRALLDQGRRELGEIAAQVVHEHADALSSVRAQAGLDAAGDGDAIAWPVAIPDAAASDGTDAAESPTARSTRGTRVAAVAFTLAALLVVGVTLAQALRDGSAPEADGEPATEGEAVVGLDDPDPDDPDPDDPDPGDPALEEAQPESGPEANESDGGEADPSGDPVPDFEPPGEAEAEGARIVDVELRSEIQGQLGPDEPLRIAVAYEGTEPGTPLRGEWTVDGEGFRALEATLPTTRGTHVVGERVPPGGWTPGAHRVLLLIGDDGAQVGGVVTFVVE